MKQCTTRVGLSEGVSDEEEVDDDDEWDDDVDQICIVDKTSIPEVIDVKDQLDDVPDHCNHPGPAFQTPESPEQQYTNDSPDNHVGTNSHYDNPEDWDEHAAHNHQRTKGKTSN